MTVIIVFGVVVVVFLLITNTYSYKKLFSLLILTCTFSFGQVKKNIAKGKITYLEMPLVKAEIRVAHTDTTVRTDLNGMY